MTYRKQFAWRRSSPLMVFLLCTTAVVPAFAADTTAPAQAAQATSDLAYAKIHNHMV